MQAQKQIYSFQENEEAVFPMDKIVKGPPQEWWQGKQEESSQELQLSGLNSDEQDMVIQSRELPELHELLDYCSNTLQPMGEQFATNKHEFGQKDFERLMQSYQENKKSNEKRVVDEKYESYLRHIEDYFHSQKGRE